MNWQSAILIHSLVISLSTLATRAVAKQKHALNSALIFNAIMLIFMWLVGIALLPFLDPINYSALLAYLPWFIGGGLAFSFAYYFSYKTLIHLDAGISGIMGGAIGALLTVILAVIFLGEELMPSQVVGGCILLSSVCYVLTIAKQPGSHRKHSRSWLIGLMFVFLASFCFSVGIVNEKYLLGHMQTSTYLLFGVTAETMFTVAAAFIFARNTLAFMRRKNVFRLAATGGALRGIGVYFFILALVKSNNAALVTVVSSVKVIITVILGAILLREKDKLVEKLTAAFLAMAGLGIIFWN